MNFIKATALILTVAVLNPLCCCLQLFADEASSESQPMQMDHSCCIGESETHQKNQADSHDTGNCPHQIEKSSQISQSIDQPDLQAKLTFHFEPLDLTTELLSFSHESATLRYSRISQSLPQAPPVLEAYCVRLL